MSYYLVDPGLAKQQLTQERIGHYFKSTVIGYPGYVTWKLLNYDDATKTVTLDIDGQTQFQNLNDLGGLSYLGPVKPAQPGPGPGQGPGTGPGPGTGAGMPQFCMYNPWHPACWGGGFGGGFGGGPGFGGGYGGGPGFGGGQGGQGGGGFGRGYVTWVPVFVPLPDEDEYGYQEPVAY